MTANDIMSSDVACCTPDAPLHEVAALMTEHHCGEIPVCDDARRPIGVVTDRDIVCRVIAQERNPADVTAGDCMTEPVITGTKDMSIEDCARLMEQYQIRRLPIVDANGACCGMVAVADLATKASRGLTAEVVGTVSEPTATASVVAGL